MLVKNEIQLEENKMFIKQKKQSEMQTKRRRKKKQEIYKLEIQQLFGVFLTESGVLIRVIDPDEWFLGLLILIIGLCLMVLDICIIG